MPAAGPRRTPGFSWRSGHSPTPIHEFWRELKFDDPVFAFTATLRPHLALKPGTNVQAVLDLWAVLRPFALLVASASSQTMQLRLDVYIGIDLGVGIGVNIYVSGVHVWKGPSEEWAWEVAKWPIWGKTIPLAGNPDHDPNDPASSPYVRYGEGSIGIQQLGSGRTGLPPPRGAPMRRETVTGPLGGA
jgi:hypothetical protein